MKKVNKRRFFLAGCLLATFILWTGLVYFMDVKPIGPQGSSVCFSTVNKLVHDLTGVHMWLYTVTDWLGLVPLLFAVGFALLGLIQWIQRKKLLNVDYSILVLGGFYLATMALYIFFETVVINYRPILIDGFFKASYPSSTTILVLCVMPTAILQFRTRIKNNTFRQCTNAVITAFILFMVVGRLISGVHWVTDIVGGILLSWGLVILYRAVIA